LKQRSIRFSRPGVLGADPTENTTSHGFHIVVMGGCVAIAPISLRYLLAVSKQQLFLLAVVALQRYYYTLQHKKAVGKNLIRLFVPSWST
jgi:hypothetical protein